MKKYVIAGLIVLLALSVNADPPWSIKVDFDGNAPPKLELFEKNVRTLTVTLLNKTNINCTGSSPIYYFFDSDMNCTTCTCSWVNSTTSVYSVSIQSNQLSTAGEYTYGAGISNSVGVTVANRGTLSVKSDPNH